MNANGKEIFLQLQSVFGFGIAIILVSGCVSSDHIVGAAAVSKYPPVKVSTKVCVLPPSITFEDLATQTPLDEERYNGPQTARALTEMTLAALRTKGVEAFDPGADPAILQGDKILLEKIAAGSHLLFLSTPNRQVLENVRELVGTNSKAGAIVLAQYIRVKIGPGPYVDPIFSGAAGADTTTSRFHAALIDARSSRFLWQEYVLLRGVPQPGKKDFSQTVKTLYSSLQPQLKNQ
jgi:hypothetical protein